MLGETRWSKKGELRILRELLRATKRVSRARVRLPRCLNVPLAAWTTLRDSIVRCRRGFEMKKLARSQFHTFLLPSSYPDDGPLDQPNETAIRESGASGRTRLPTSPLFRPRSLAISPRSLASSTSLSIQPSHSFLRPSRTLLRTIASSRASSF